MKATITKSTGSFYRAVLENNEEITCRIKGKFRLHGLPLTNPVAVGDEVIVNKIADDYIIDSICDRKNYVIRQSPRKKHFLHIIASNIDQVLLIVSIKEPKLKPGFIDRFLLMTEPYDIPVIINFNKSDLYKEKEMEVFNHFKSIYEKLGYKVHMSSALKGNGLEKLKICLKDKTTLVSGQSGVGKTSLINTLNLGFDLKTNNLSNYTGKGQHTTTFAEMFDLSDGGKIIDSPGIKTLGFNHLSLEDVKSNFREIFEYSKECQYNDCLHRVEPKCAVQKAVENNEISEFRYLNYLQILDEIEGQNYWEIKSTF